MNIKILFTICIIITLLSSCSKSTIKIENQTDLACDIYFKAGENVTELDNINVLLATYENLFAHQSKEYNANTYYLIAIKNTIYGIQYRNITTNGDSMIFSPVIKYIIRTNGVIRE